MRYLKTTILCFFILILLVLSGGFIVGYLYEDEVKEYLLEEINKKLNTEVIVDSKNIQFSVLKRFPYASLEFYDIIALDAVQSDDRDTLLEASSVSLQFNIIDVFIKNYRIKKIDLKDAVLNIRYDKQGKDNYHLWKSTSDTSASNTLVSIEKILLNNVWVNYQDDHLNLYTSFDIQKGSMTGNFSSDEYVLDTQAKLFSRYFKYDGTNYADQKNVELNLSLEVNKNSYRIQHSTIKIADLNVAVSGEVVSHEKYNQLNLLIKGEDLNIVSVLSILPEKFAKNVEEYESKGDFYFETSIKGKVSDKLTPVIKATFGITNGTISYTKNNLNLNQVNIKGSLYKDEGKEELLVNNFSTRITEGFVSGNFQVINFSDPYLSALIEANIDLAEVKKFIARDTLESLSGKAKLNLKYFGKAANFQKCSPEELKQIKASGEMQITDAGVHIKNNSLELSNLNGAFLFDNNNLVITEFKGNALESDFVIKGFLKNVFAYIFAEDEQLTIEASLASNKLNLNEIMQNKQVENVSDTSYSLKFSPLINLNLTGEVKRIVFRNFEATDITGTLKLSDQKLSTDAIAFSTMDGSILITNGLIDANRDKEVLITCDASLKKININKMFTQLENFGQDVIIDENLKGVATVDIQFASVWSHALNVDLDKVYVKSNLTIEKGELIKFEYLKSLSKFIKLSELEQVKFSTLKNQIEIKNKKIYIPQMEINSSAINLTASGTHTFDNEIDYKIKLLLSDVLSKKARASKKENDEFGVIEDDGLGKTALYFSMTGSVYNPVIKYDRKSAVKTIKEDFKIEKQNLKQLLKDEFGWFKKDSTAVNKKQEEKKKDDKFIIKWDENEQKNKKKKAEDDEEEDF